MIAWLALLVPALAQAPNPNQCSNDDAFPIMGSAGFENTLAALRTNAATYSAANFVEEKGLRRIANSDAEQLAVGEFAAHMTFGVTRVPVFQEDATYGECPANYLLATRPVDLQAYNLGLAFRYKRIGGFYAASVALGYPAETAGLRPLQAFGGAVTAPMLLPFLPLGGSYAFQTGASAYAQDFVLGVVADAEIVDLRLGYTQSRGWYLSAFSAETGAFGSVVLRDGLSVLGQFKGGLDRVPLPEDIAETVGRPSAFARILPLTDALPIRDAAGQPTGETLQQDLVTGHLELEGIGGMLDVRGAYATKPTSLLREASVAVHDRGYYALGDATGETSIRFYAEGGFVRLPDQWYYGLEGGVFPQFRANVGQAWGDPEESYVVGSVGVLYNDPEQTALYPFARNALTFQVDVGGTF